MNRLNKIVIRNIHRIPGLFVKLYYYNNHPDKYTKEQRHELLEYIVERTKISGGIEIEVFGRENIPKENGYIFYPNHQGIFDGFAMTEACPTPFSPVIKIELMDVPVINQIFRCMDAMAMNREDARQSVEVIQEVVRRVKQKENCLIFPEGTRSKKGNELGDFKAGSFKAAKKAMCPIVPVALINSYLPFDKNEKGQVTVQVHILQEIPYEEYQNCSTKEMAELVKIRIQDTITANLNRF